MADRFRLSYQHALCPNIYTRPTPPHWLRHGRVIEYAEYSKRVSYTYWTKLYWATPPWLNEAQLKEMANIYYTAGKTEHVDHIVPLKNPLVCGLHVPWNLQILDAKVNMTKSNKWWPDHPFENLDLFGEPV